MKRQILLVYACRMTAFWKETGPFLNQSERSVERNFFLINWGMRLIFKIWKEFVTSMLQDMLSVRQNLFSVTVVLIDENEMVDDGIEYEVANHELNHLW